MLYVKSQKAQNRDYDLSQIHQAAPLESKAKATSKQAEDKDRNQSK